MPRDKRAAQDREGRDPRAILSALSELRASCLATEREYAALLSSVRPIHAASARNLVHYLALRRHDLRELQADLARLGVSSLGRCEPHVLGTLDAVISVLGHLTGATRDPVPLVATAEPVVRRNAAGLLGAVPKDRSMRVMVTLPSAAARDAGLVGDLVAAGMTTARINCAHDNPAAWRAMAANVRTAAGHAGRTVRIAADLAGPKLRTGPLGPGLPVLRVGPERDERGRVLQPAQILLCPLDDAGLASDVTRVPVTDETWLRACQPGDIVWLRDARDAARRLTVVSSGEEGVVMATRRTIYLESGLPLERRAGSDRSTTTIGPLPPREPYVTLRVGDEFVLTACAGTSTSEPAGPVRVPCTMPEVLEHAQPGHLVWFDDGRIGAVVVGRRAHGLLLRVTRARPSGSRLRGGKGINLPDTYLPIPGLTAQDEDDLAHVIDLVDVIDVSFVRSAEDVTLVQRRLADLGAGDVGIIFKIETVSGFTHLPEILLTAMRSAHVGVMIARGDLAVEAGFERLAEVQEEILWLCEAAHVPVVWATQVLDQLARTGRPSRSEVTDVALGARAECIMLNKGPHIVEAMAAQRDIHGRMHEHQHKKSALLRRLRAWDPEVTTSRPRPGERVANVP